MNVPENLKYTETHEWVELTSGGTARVGLTDHAQKALGELVFVNLPEPGDSVTAGERMGDVESIKSVSDVISPLTGTVAAVNEELADNPGNINAKPYEAWLVELSGADSDAGLMDASEYTAFCQKEEH